MNGRKNVSDVDVGGDNRRIERHCDGNSLPTHLPNKREPLSPCLLRKRGAR
jgi:hypothetical protein